MAQSSLMYYCYFRFYVDESEIIAGMDKFCTGWEHMFAVGYNYHEYKCFVDNLGGFEHWVGDMRGYISQTRETGFLDGSPSDAVFDQSLLMGSERVLISDVEMLNGYSPNTNFVFRKISAQDVGIAHKVSFTCGGEQEIEHPVMYTLDNKQIEIIKQTVAGIVDNSDVDSYNMMVDVDKTLFIGSQYSLSYGTVTDFNLAFNRSKLDFLHFTTPISDVTTAYLVIDLGSTFTNIAVQGYNGWNGGGIGNGKGNGNTSIHYSSSPVGGWILLGSTGHVSGDFSYNTVGTSARYVRITSDPSVDWNTTSDIYRLFCS